MWSDTYIVATIVSGTSCIVKDAESIQSVADTIVSGTDSLVKSADTIHSATSSIVFGTETIVNASVSIDKATDSIVSCADTIVKAAECPLFIGKFIFIEFMNADAFPTGEGKRFLLPKGEGPDSYRERMRTFSASGCNKVLS